MDAKEVLHPVTEAFNSAILNMLWYMGTTFLTAAVCLVVIWLVYDWAERNL